MTDPYENIRKALAMGPTPGPWRLYRRDDWHGPIVQRGKQGGFVVRGLSPAAEDADAALIAACDPDTIRELLAERDALLEACCLAARYLNPDQFPDAVKKIDAAIDQARGKGGGEVGP